MADRQAQIPGGAYFNDVEEASLAQRQIPGAQFVNETQQAAGGGGVFQKITGNRFALAGPGGLAS